MSFVSSHVQIYIQCICIVYVESHVLYSAEQLYRQVGEMYKYVMAIDNTYSDVESSKTSHHAVGKNDRQNAYVMCIMLVL